ncbi:hypothetical protein E2C01_059460 [Portunus trituberculatus]|uniref:Uncharacterized protein n=1 Tax=Portunus trituberculatus TaxID=210409 RepID=A0A5B7H7T3_PORTR|nr:hypothetical protein [Portunus trituberculatus]
MTCETTTSAEEQGAAANVALYWMNMSQRGTPQERKKVQHRQARQNLNKGKSYHTNERITNLSEGKGCCTNKKDKHLSREKGCSTNERLSK